jgi:DNA-binding response OmpR family regulator
VKVAQLDFDPGARTLSAGEGHEIVLQPRQARLLKALAADPHRVFSKRELVALFEGTPSGSLVSTRTVDHIASRLRRRLEEAGQPGLIVNCWGVGYRLEGEI